MIAWLTNQITDRLEIKKSEKKKADDGLMNTRILT